MKSKTPPPNLWQLLLHDDLGWSVVLLVAVIAIIVGVSVNFIDKVHYDNLLIQAQGKASIAQILVGNEQYDVRFLVDNSPGQINCFDLRSSYARNLCNTHNSSLAAHI